MRNLKKFLALVLAMMMTLSLMVTVNAATSSADGAWAQIEKHAETIQKAGPTLTWAEAVDKACEQHPDLVHEYESGR